MLDDVRSSFLSFFAKNGHGIQSSSSLVPHGDATLLFVNSGMVQFKDYFIGLKNPPFKNAATAQKCVRAGGKHNDLDNVGYTNRHHTFFEMLGNFSFGGYFKEEAIFYAYNLLVNELKIDRSKLYFTVYHTDDEAFNLWKKIAGVEESRIIRINTNDNFWSMGDVGPCGPCSEIFYDHGDSVFGGLPGTKDQDGARYTEIWNLVFMQYEQLNGGGRVELPQKCIDTGSGLERLVATLEGKIDNYDIGFFVDFIKFISLKTGLQNSGESKFVLRVVADHIRCAVFLMSDGILPSNEGRGYVLRRIIRRMLRLMYVGNVRGEFLRAFGEYLIGKMSNVYPEILTAKGFILEQLELEERRFLKVLPQGLKILEAECMKMSSSNKFLDGQIAFMLYDTYGFPLDITTDVCKKFDVNVDVSGFETAMQEQRKRGEVSWVGDGNNLDVKQQREMINSAFFQHGATKFIGYDSLVTTAKVKAIVGNGLIFDKTVFYPEGGGQVSDKGVIECGEVVLDVIDVQKIDDVIVHYVQDGSSVMVGDEVELSVDKILRMGCARNHTATHLLHYVLRKHLGEGITQKGSLVSPDKLRFDFAYQKALSVAQIEVIERDVNDLIMANEMVGVKYSSKDEAVKSGAMALFGEKYDSEVRVVSAGSSVELCGGIHAKSTGDIGVFVIIGESSVASGVRRVEALTGCMAVKYVRSKLNEYSQVCIQNKLPQEDGKILEYVESLKGKIRESEEVMKVLHARVISQAVVEKYGDYNLVKLKDYTAKEMALYTAGNHYDKVMIFVSGEALVCRVPKMMLDINAKEVLEKYAAQYGKKFVGGGPKDFVTGNMV